ncbi:6-hydroxymethylpterin diphosphokinase MptE-like protein [Paenibacillus qinlingensis]|uniref:motility associated factor glycosyltransferase family protein n=1 Tax=Paenibacillus qinlingensis TaxID=1837343 RepID=UPI00286DCA67|nr:6-hydroxymethylpterin diphosphokinase MptE-like protein [Paenibacillus qinlingensis]
MIATKANDGFTIKYNNYFLHSMYNPQAEAVKFAEKHYQKGHLHVLFGIGMGYIAQEIIKKMSDNDYLLILEPEQDILEQCLKEEQNKNLLDLENVQISQSSNRDLVRRKFPELFEKHKKKFTLIISLNYEKAFPEDYKEVTTLFKDLVEEAIIYLNTGNRFAQDWQVNFTHNLYSGFEANALSQLAGQLDCPIVIASGGPSLMKQIPFLKMHRDKFFLICAGSTIGTLTREQIFPDLVVAIDGGIANYNHFKNIQTDVPLAFPFQIHEKIPKEYKGSKFVFHLLFHKLYNELIAKVYGTKLTTFPGAASVANASLGIATYISKGPICLIGQDLAYTDNATHADGNESQSTFNEDYKRARGMFYTQGYYKDPILTDAVFMTMKRWFEDFIQQTDRAKTIFNCTEGGAKIEGMNQMPFELYIDRYCNGGYEIPQIIEISEKNIRTIKEWKNFQQIMNEISFNLKKAQKIAKTASDEMINNKGFTPKLIKSLDRYDQTLAECMENNFLYFILTPLINNIMYGSDNLDHGNDKENRQVIYNKSLYMYQTVFQCISEIAPHVEEVLLKINERVQDIEKGNIDYE